MSVVHPPRILFRHIAKTGGTTLLNHFRNEFGAEAMCVLGPHNRCKRFFGGLPQIEELDSAARDRFRVIQGHGVSDAAVGLMQDPEMRLFVVLREPVSLARSRFNQRFNAKGRKDLNVTPEFFMRKLAGDYMSRSLIESFPSLIDADAQTPFEKARSVLRKFDYVYTTESMSTQLGPMLRAYGLSEKIERKRVAEHKEPLPASDNEIRALNDVDCALYDLAARPVESDGHSHNALGFEAEAKRAAFESMVQSSRKEADAWQQHCYTELSEALCRELRGEAAYRLLDAGQAPVADPLAFRKALDAQWDVKSASLSEIGKDRADFLARQLERKLGIKTPARKAAPGKAKV